VDDVEVPASLAETVVGASAQMGLVREWIVRAARHAEPVLLLGETGTGKGVVAKAIHDQQFGTLKPFQPVNCGAVPAELFESEFFGYMPGSFTNGLKAAPGHRIERRSPGWLHGGDRGRCTYRLGDQPRPSADDRIR
jgi:DNA-binding NtrC family response regulator